MRLSRLTSEKAPSVLVDRRREASGYSRSESGMDLWIMFLYVASVLSSIRSSSSEIWSSSEICGEMFLVSECEDMGTKMHCKISRYIKHRKQT